MPSADAKKVNKVFECVIKSDLPVPEFIGWFSVRFNDFFPNYDPQREIYLRFETQSTKLGARIIITASKLDPLRLSANPLLASVENFTPTNIAYVDLLPSGEGLGVNLYIIELEAGRGLKDLFIGIYQAWKNRYSVVIKQGETILREELGSDWIESQIPVINAGGKFTLDRHEEKQDEIISSSEAIKVPSPFPKPEYDENRVITIATLEAYFPNANERTLKELKLAQKLWDIDRLTFAQVEERGEITRSTFQRRKKMLQDKKLLLR